MGTLATRGVSPARRAVLAVAAAVLAAGLLGPARARGESAHHWKVVVHPSNPMRSVTRESLDRIYRRRTRFWPDGSPVLALNLPGGDPLRRDFSLEVLRDDEDDLATFWNRQYFQGIDPPTVLQSSRAVKTFVAATPSSIGYIAEEEVDASVAVVEVRDER